MKKVTRYFGVVEVCMRTLHIFITLIIATLMIGCSSNSGIKGSSDLTGSKVLVAYVNADEIFLISIQKRIDDVLNWLRSQESIFYQPSPDDLLKLANISLKREIRKTGLKQPGMEISRDAKFERAGIIAKQQSETIMEMLNAGAKLEEIATQFNLKLPASSQKIYKGVNPDYDGAIFAVEKGQIAGPVISEDRVFIFRVDDKGKDNDGSDWADVYPIGFLFPENEAQEQLIAEMMQKWDIKIVHPLYLAISEYYKGNIDSAEQALLKYLKGEGKRDPLGHYLMSRIYSKEIDEAHDQTLAQKIQQELKKAAEVSDDPKLTPYFRYTLGQFLYGNNQPEPAKVEFRKALDEVRSDLYLVTVLLDVFEKTGDAEYTTKAREMKENLDAQIKVENSAKPRKPEVKSVVMTGEGPLGEDPEEIWKEKDKGITEENDESKGQE